MYLQIYIEESFMTLDLDDSSIHHVKLLELKKN